MFRRDADLPGVEVMLGDFGVAHLPDAQGQATASASSRKNESVGTLANMSPEQRRREDDPIRRPDNVAEEEPASAEAARERERVVARQLR